ncbi:hypothetical protein [Haloferula sp. BvORR071]|uniref:hypothetical protein n=1 Tax=Haloferula sp. BvORR071 TaxID=1396141 RepID=UPI002240F93B|nr:hypothetical protein [Haloferula sp. BvORR071]
MSPEELTPAALEAMRRWSTDTGRNFALILAIPVSLIWTTLNFAILAFLGWLRSRIKSAKQREIGKRVRVVLPHESPRTRE